MASTVFTKVWTGSSGFLKEPMSLLLHCGAHGWPRSVLRVRHLRHRFRFQTFLIQKKDGLSFSKFWRWTKIPPWPLTLGAASARVFWNLRKPKSWDSLHAWPASCCRHRPPVNGATGPAALEAKAEIMELGLPSCCTKYFRYEREAAFRITTFDFHTWEQDQEQQFWAAGPKGQASPAWLWQDQLVRWLVLCSVWQWP